MKSKNHINCRCSSIALGYPPRHGKSLLYEKMKEYGHYNATFGDDLIDSINTALANELKKKHEKEVEKMGLRIKKSDEMSIDEFKENTKAYNTIKLIINKEKYDKVEKEYGAEPFETGYSDDGYEIILKDEIIEFKEKAITIDLTVFKNKCIPYYFIDKVIGTYYIKTEQ